MKSLKYATAGVLSFLSLLSFLVIPKVSTASSNCVGCTWMGKEMGYICSSSDTGAEECTISDGGQTCSVTGGGCGC